MTASSSTGSSSARFLWRPQRDQSRLIMNHQLRPQQAAISRRPNAIQLLLARRNIPNNKIRLKSACHQMRKHRINKSQKHFSKQRTSLQQPAAPLLFLLHASRRRPHLPQMHPRKHSSSSPGEGVDAPDLVPSLTTGSSTPGSTLFQRKWPNCVPKKGQLIQHRIKTAVGVRHAGMERALRAAASTETFKARGSVRAP